MAGIKSLIFVKFKLGGHPKNAKKASNPYTKGHQHCYKDFKKQLVDSSFDPSRFLSDW